MILVTVVFLGTFRLHAADVFPLDVPRGLDLYIPTPDSNPLTAEKIDLGRKLFFDQRLSRDQSTSCASCHDPAHAFTVAKRIARGAGDQQAERNPPALINRAYGRAFFWDGRAPTLEAQVLEPIKSARELNLTLEEMEQRLRHDADYQELFKRAFGRPPNVSDTARALASFIRSLISGDSPYDRYMLGDQQTFSEAARRGLELFRGKANCSACHAAPNVTDERFHNTGVAWRDGHLLDVGRFAITGKDQDRGAFKTPTLREIARTAPYMHDGSLATLEEVIDYYNRGGNANANLDPELRPLHLTAKEKQSLLEFLKALSSITDANSSLVGRISK